MGHVSSMAHLRFQLVNGDTAPDPHVSACLRVGDNGDDSLSLPELSITDTRCRAQHGRLTWDADHRQNGPDSPFFSVAAVRLDLKSDGQCLLSVGTSPFIRFSAAPFRWVEKVQVAAAAGTLTPHRSIQWDWIELDLRHADGDVETRPSACLPKIVTGSGVRRAVQAGPGVGQVPRQFAELATGSTDVIALKLRGQVTLRANEAAESASPLGAEDLLGSILVFTDASCRSVPRRGSRRARRR